MKLPESERGLGSHIVQLLEILDGEAGEQCAQFHVQAVEFEKAPVGMRCRGKSIRNANAFGYEVTDHFAKRSILAAHDRNIGNSKLFKPEQLGLFSAA